MHGNVKYVVIAVVIASRNELFRDGIGATGVEDQPAVSIQKDVWRRESAEVWPYVESALFLLENTSGRERPSAGAHQTSEHQDMPFHGFCIHSLSENVVP